MATQMARTTHTNDETRAAVISSIAGASFMRQVAAIFLMAAGIGWNAGNFVQPVNTSWGAVADILHAVPLAILLPLALRVIGAGMAGMVARGARNGITVLALIGIIGCSVMVVLGAINPDPNSVGVHTPEDWMPVIVLNAGNLLWVGTLLFGRRGARA
jgi:hypothetical protein